ncbi:MAG: PAS domain-containing protein [Dehalococcoidia bacterium]
MAKKKQTDRLRKKAEINFDPAELDIESMDRPNLEKLVNKLAIHQHELEIQNEKLRKSHKELEEVRDKYHDLFEFAPVGYFTLSKQNLIVEANLTGCAMLNLPRKSAPKRRFTDFIAPWEADRFSLHRKEVLKSDKPQICELGMVKEDGTHFAARLYSQHIAGGRLRLAVMNISDFREKEEALAHHKDLLQHVIDNIPVLMVMWDAQLQQFTLNRHAEEVLGWTTEDANEGDFMSKVYPDADYRAQVAAYMQSLEPGWREWIITTRDGREVPIDWANVKVGEETMIGIGVDLSERKKWERAIKRQNELLIGINRIFEAVVASATEEEFGSSCLEVAEAITGSAISFLGEIGPDGSFREIAVSNHPSPARPLYDEKGQPGPASSFHTPGIYNSVLREGKTFIANDPASHPALAELPEGHPPLTSFLGVPLHQHDRLTGMIAVANREGGYGPEERESLEALAPTIVEALIHRRVEQAILESQAEYKKLADSISDIFFALDSDLKFTFWNRASEKAVGRPAEKVLGRFVRDVFPDTEETRKTVQAYRKAMETGQTQTLFNEFYLNDTPHHFHVTIYPAAEGVSVFARDISYEVQLQALLASQAAVQEAVIENTPAQLAYFDADFNFVAVNSTYAESAGYSREELIGKNYFDLFPDEDYEAIFTEVRDSGTAVVDYDKPFQFPNQMERGVTYWNWSLIPVTDKSGAVRGLVHTLLETTERVLAQSTCQRYERLATLGEISGTISHELRNPLATVDNCVFVLRRRLKDSEPKVLENLDRIKSSVDRCVAVIQSLLNFTRMKEPVKVPLHMNAVISEAIKEEGMPPGLSLQKQLPSEQVVVHGDRELLMVCFGNIIRNAVEAMEGEGVLTIAVEQSDGWLAASFADTGPGIPAENMRSITEPLFSTKATGAGFGLAVANQVAEKHGGGLKFNSAVGEGTTVTVYLPLPSGEE